MKKVRRILALLLALLPPFLFSCGETASEPPKDSSAPAETQTDGEGRFDWHDTIFPGEDVPKIDFGSFENYKTFRDLVKKGGSGPDEAIAFAREKLQIVLMTLGDYEPTHLETAEQAETLVAETENLKILLPQNEDWTLSSFSRGGSISSPDGNGGVIMRSYKRCLSYSFHNDALGSISFAVFYDDATRNHTPRQFYRWGTENQYYTGYHTEDNDYTCKYVTPAPYFTLPFDSGETLNIFRLDDYSEEKGFLFTDNSEIIISYTFQNFETDQLTAPTKEEKETILRAFFEGARVVTLAEAVG